METLELLSILTADFIILTLYLFYLYDTVTTAIKVTQEVGNEDKKVKSKTDEVEWSGV